MISNFIKAYLIIIVATLPLFVSASPKLKIDSPWVRAMPPGASMTAGYMTITNEGSEKDELISISSTAAGSVEIHQSYIENGMHQMKAVSKLEIPAGKKVNLSPGGYHLMLHNIKEDLQPGKDIIMNAKFKKSGNKKILAKVRK